MFPETSDATYAGAFKGMFVASPAIAGGCR